MAIRGEKGSLIIAYTRCGGGKIILLSIIGDNTDQMRKISIGIRHGTIKLCMTFFMCIPDKIQGLHR